MAGHVWVPPGHDRYPAGSAHGVLAERVREPHASGRERVDVRTLRREQELVQLYNDAYLPIMGGRHPQAMGGRGTMGRWYNAEPRLVSADFIHPMPRGAKLVGNLLYRGLINGYHKYKTRGNRSGLAGNHSANER